MYDYEKMDLNLKENHFHLNRLLLALFGYNIYSVDFINGDMNDLRNENIQILV